SVQPARSLIASSWNSPQTDSRPFAPPDTSPSHACGAVRRGTSGRSGEWQGYPRGKARQGQEDGGWRDGEDGPAKSTYRPPNRQKRSVRLAIFTTKVTRSASVGQEG